MLGPNIPEVERMLRKEREQEVERAIKRRLAWEALDASESSKQHESWYVLALRWLGDKISHHTARKQAAKPALVE